MNKSKAIDKFNKKANEWLIELEKTTNEDLLINPSKDSWSLSELYDHIMRVARTYQMPNLKKSVSSLAERKKRKNKIGWAVFNFGIRKQVKIQMQRFPAPLVIDFTPQKRAKADLILDFKQFIQEVNDLKKLLMDSKRSNKHYHPMFGDINTLEWFSLIEIHMSHHDIQKKRLKKHLSTQ